MGQPPPPPPWSSQPPVPPQPPWPSQPPPGPPPGYGPPAAGPQHPYGAAPQPGWPPPPSYGPAPAPRRGGGGKVVGIVLGVVGGLALLCGGAGVLVYLSGAFGDDPVEVVEAYFAAAERGDCEQMIDRLTEATWRQGGATSRGQAVTECEQVLDATDSGFLVELESARLVSERGDTAVVAATLAVPPLGLEEELDPGPLESEITLSKEGRTWLIDGTASQNLGPGFETGLGIPGLPELDDPGEDPGLEDDPGQDSGTPASLSSDELYSSPTFSFRIDLGDRVLEGELELIESYDHASCDATGQAEQVRAALANCVSRIEGAYVGAGGGLWVSQQVLLFADQASAESFYAMIEEVYAGDMFPFEDPGGMDGTGYLATRPGQQGQYVVVTLLASASGSDAAIQEVQDHAHARHAESMSYLIWR